jgi:hypothetical protein
MYLHGGAGNGNCKLQLIHGFLLRFKRSVMQLARFGPSRASRGHFPVGQANELRRMD